MSWMNEYEIEEALRFTARFELPNLRRGAEVLSRLKDWTNRNSDGWPYWQPPSRAASKLQDALVKVRGNYLRVEDQDDITEAELRRMFTPIKSFLTRQKVDQAEVFGP